MNTRPLRLGTRASALATTQSGHVADAITELSCAELSGWSGKADNPWCIWTPWLCAGDSGTTGDNVTITGIVL